MLPQDIPRDKGLYIYKSGGSVGAPTPTFITALDREIESEAFKRGFEYEGLKAGDRVLTTYNPSHKGGEEIKEALVRLGASCMLRRTTDSPKEVIESIVDYDVNILLTSQGPVVEGDQQQKGGGASLLQLIEAGQNVLEEKIEILFLGGYRLVPEAISWAEANEKPLVSLLGSSEAIPQATNRFISGKDTRCRYNNLHVMNGPHYIEVLKEEDGMLVPAKKGELGILAYTTVAREGTIYLRYLPGDQARVLANEGECDCGLKSEIITDVSRIDIPDDVIKSGCCIG
jgi:phenylacetate-coenzyme A ligase PaaK-like adenylate-forming protein